MQQQGWTNRTSAITKVNAQNANTTLSNLISTTKINADLLPDNTNTRSLGSSGKSWKNIFVKGAYFLNGNKFISNAGTSNTFIGTSTGNSNTPKALPAPKC